MEKKSSRKISKKAENGKVVEFDAASVDTGTSPAIPIEPEGAVDALDAAAPPVEPEIPAADEKNYSPEFLELAMPKLPNLGSHGNRARLLMQTPNRLYFYWAVGKNPFHTLNRAVGHSSNYTLVLKLVDLRNDNEQIFPVDASGNWWFDVDADGEYRAEIGFYAVNRPYIRVLYSNTVTTPRKNPSPRSADTAEWRVPAVKFAEVLEAAGFQRDAFDVVLAGDDVDAAEGATRSAFAQFSGRKPAEFASLEAAEMRYAMLAIASGIPLEQLRGLISERLFRFLSSLGTLDGELALASLKTEFEFDEEEFEIEEEVGPTVFGASQVHFPRRSRKGKRLSELNPLEDFGGVKPVSSHKTS